MYAIVSFKPPLLEGERLTEREVRSILKERGIVYGILETFFQKDFPVREYDKKYIVAQGLPSVNGRDGKINIKIDLSNDIKLEEDESGKVDFKNLKAVKSVLKGDLLAEKEEPTDGISGFNVYGKELISKKGKEVTFKNGGNTIIINNALYAECDGQLLISRGLITVSPIYRVNGDINHSTGNIDFVGNVLVEGNVRSGFSIKAGGNIEVKGVVEDAVLQSGGSIIIHKGVQGGNGKLVAKENIVAKFFQNTKVEAGRDIIAESALHSHLISGNNIIIKSGKGTIAGGRAVATSKIEVKVLGSSMSTLTEVKIGIPIEVYNRLKEIEPEYKKMATKVDELAKNIKYLSTKTDLTDVSKKKLMNKLLAQQEALEIEYENLHLEYERLHFIHYGASEGVIKVSEKINYGVTIGFGETERTVTSPQNECIIVKELGDIVFKYQ